MTRALIAAVILWAATARAADGGLYGELQARWERKDYAGALAALEREAVARPDHEDVLSFACFVYHEVLDVTRGLPACMRLTEIYPQWSYPWRQLVRLYFTAERAADARSALEQARKLEPGEKLDELDAWLSDFERALRGEQVAPPAGSPARVVHDMARDVGRVGLGEGLVRHSDLPAERLRRVAGMLPAAFDLSRRKIQGWSVGQGEVVGLVAKVPITVWMTATLTREEVEQTFTPMSTDDVRYQLWQQLDPAGRAAWLARWSGPQRDDWTLTVELSKNAAGSWRISQVLAPNGWPMIAAAVGEGERREDVPLARRIGRGLGQLIGIVLLVLLVLAVARRMRR